VDGAVDTTPTSTTAEGFPPGVAKPPRTPTVLSAGIVAHNEERNLEAAVRSLLDQDLPEHTAWESIWIVASGCTDGTVAVAEYLARDDPRVRVLIEPERMGKAHALREVFVRARGSALVLLNADARAEGGAIRALLDAARDRPAPFAVMGRPVPPEGTEGRWGEELRLMWALHHEFHLELQRLGGGAHLSDELLLVSLPGFPSLPDGTINDGSYFGVWLSQHGGDRLYAPEARVTVDVPWSVRDHLEQRRRILYGNQQVTVALGRAPSTFVRFALRSPARAVELLRRADHSRRPGWTPFARLAAAEAVAVTLASWDRLPPRNDHVRWRRIRSTAAVGSVGLPAGHRLRPPIAHRSPAHVEGRVAAIVGAASQFGTGVALPELVRLLPNEGPSTVTEVRQWLESRPHLARLDGERAFAPDSAMDGEAERARRGLHYLEQAHELFAGPLHGSLRWTRCVCVTGSAAYGEPGRGDDLDLFVVTRRGSQWWFLFSVYLTLRIARARPGNAREPLPCFNYVLDDSQADREFTGNRGFLFAREALTARPVSGPRYYRGLLSRASWMAEEIPRLYSERNGDPTAPDGDALPIPFTVRLLNAALFPGLAAYLQLVGLLRNGRFRRAARHDDRFRVETRWRKLVFASRKFERLRESYRNPTAHGTIAPPRRGAAVRPSISETAQGCVSE
jgi:glycosyltransferase involved in cell wall biosynthesis